MTSQTQKFFHIGNILLLVCAISCLVFYDLHGGLWLKGVTSSWFALLGLLNLCYARRIKLKSTRYLLLMEAGLVIGMCADVLLGVQFLLGLLFFALGHVLYLTAFFTLEKPQPKDLLFIVPIAALSLFLVVGTPYIRVEDPMLEKLLLVYAIIIACMLGKAASNFTLQKAPSRCLLFLGSAMFWFSDLMLAIDLFGTGSRLIWILCSYTYWPGQSILAYSMYHYVSEQYTRACKTTNCIDIHAPV